MPQNAKIKDLVVRVLLALADTTDSPDQRVVLALYRALLSRDVSTVHRILAPDLEWWFHGPPSHQFLMPLLTGSKRKPTSFSFKPELVTSFGSVVLAEGCDRTRSIYWVHAWTVSDGIITQVREYFNTSLTVTRFGGAEPSSEIAPAPAAASDPLFTSIWESRLGDGVGKSFPGLVLAL